MKILKKTMAILMVLLIFLVILVFSISMKKDKNSNIDYVKESVDISKYKKVTNPHMYLTVKTCVERYLNYIYQKDADSIYKILDSKYIQEFNISQENVFEYVEALEIPVILSIEEMYVLEKNENEHEYYISGTLREDIVDGISDKKIDYIITVKLDLENMIYSIIPNGYGGPLYEKR